VQALIVAGATRNPIDAVRYITARSTGRTGVALAAGLLERGADVYLLGSPEARLRGAVVPGEEFGSTRDLMERMEAWVTTHRRGAVVHAAAVGDYELAQPGADKIPSGRDRLELVLVPTPKIADQVREWGLVGPYVTFKAAPPGTEVAELEQIARRQLHRTRSDLVFANTLGRLDRDVLLVDESCRRYSKRSHAITALVDWLADRLRISSPLPAPRR